MKPHPLYVAMLHTSMWTWLWAAAAEAAAVAAMGARDAKGRKLQAWHVATLQVQRLFSSFVAVAAEVATATAGGVVATLMAASAAQAKLAVLATM